MKKSRNKLVRQLEQLEKQIDALKANYLERLPHLQTIKAKAQSPAPEAVSDTFADKNQKLLELAMKTGQKNELYKAVNKKLLSLLKSGKKTFTPEDLEAVKQTLDQAGGKTDNWEIFRQKFAAVYPGFFEKLKATYPDLTKTETRFCTYLRTGLNSHQIASVMNISMEAIRKNRYRIRKKMGLSAEESLEETIQKL